jgi:aminoglycoside phosphotransferase (APT) family kinase protein
MSDEIVARLEAFLGMHMGTAVTVIDYTPITGGYSRAMSRFWVDDGSTRRGFVMRADPPPGQSILDTDRTYEWTMLQAIHRGGVRIPTPLYFDPTGEHLGSPAFISENIEGDTLHVLANAGTVESNAQYVDRLADSIAALHTLEITQLPDALPRPTSWEQYIAECTQAWRDGEAEHAEHDPFMRTIAAWLDAYRPAPAPFALVHGDFQGPNIIVERHTGDYHYVDWELVHVGDPREDLGWWTLAMGSQPPDLIAENQDRFYARYRERTGLSEDVINPRSVAYFTVLASLPVFRNVIRMTARLGRGEPMGTTVAYMTNAIPYMHSAYVNSMKAAGHWGKDS